MSWPRMRKCVLWSPISETSPHADIKQTKKKKRRTWKYLAMDTVAWVREWMGKLPCLHWCGCSGPTFFFSRQWSVCYVVAVDDNMLCSFIVFGLGCSSSFIQKQKKNAAWQLNMLEKWRKKNRRGGDRDTRLAPVLGGKLTKRKWMDVLKMKWMQHLFFCGVGKSPTTTTFFLAICASLNKTIALPIDDWYGQGLHEYKCQCQC